MSWHPEDPRSWGGWHRTIPAGAAIGPPGAGAIPAGRCSTTSSATACPPAAPAAGQLSMVVALLLFLLSPVTLLAWAAGQAFLRLTGVRWWKLALASLAAIVAVIVVEGGPGPALAHHFSGYTVGCGRSAPPT